ncbi:hypothetical protein [Acetonema longum]|nr:hypothetical protein [Acetonema longum]
MLGTANQLGTMANDAVTQTNLPNLLQSSIAGQQAVANLELPQEYMDKKTGLVAQNMNEARSNNIAQLGRRGVINSSLFQDSEDDLNKYAANAINSNIDQGLQLYSQMANQPYQTAVSGIGQLGSLGQSFTVPAASQLDRLNQQQNAATYVKQGSSGLLGGALGAVTGGLGSALGNRLANQWNGNSTQAQPAYSFPSWNQFNSMPQNYLPNTLGVNYGFGVPNQG